MSLFLEKLEAYLQQPGSFNEGCRLLEEAGRRPPRLFTLFVMPKDRENLMKALEDLAELFRRSSTRSTTMLADAVNHVQAQKDPESVEALRQKARGLHKEMGYYHAQLVATASQEEGPQRNAALYELAKKIMEEIQPGIDETYSSLDHYRKTGEAPPAGTATDGVKLQKKKQSLRSGISRLKRLIKEADNEERKEYYLRDLEEKESELRGIVC